MSQLRTQVRWNDADDVLAWLSAVRMQAEDLHAVAEDATRPYKRRVLARPHARQRAEQAARALYQLLRVARDSLYDVIAAKPDEADVEPDPPSTSRGGGA